MSTTLTVSKEHIAKTPGVCGGKACIVGHRIRVMDIVVHHEHRGLSPEEILAVFPSITLADIHAAITYYFDNRDEISAEFAKDEALAEQFKGRFPSKLMDVASE